MAKKQPVEIATRTFGSKAEAMEFFKAMLNRYKPDDRVNEVDALDLAAVLERHPEFHQKVGCGVDHFEVMLTEEYRTQCFRIVRTNGKGTDFSYGACVSGKAPTRKQEVSAALRRVVQHDLYTACDEFFAENQDAVGTVTCAVTKERITRSEAHIDHLPPLTFEAMVSAFLAAHGMTVDDVPLTVGEDDQTIPEITDKDFAEKFRVYHNMLGKVDVVKKNVNLSQASRNRIRAARLQLDKRDKS